MAASVPNKFVGTTTQDISSLDANFDALVNFLNSGVDFQGAELVSSYATIRALTASTTSTTLAFTTGRLAMGDGGMGWFRADASDTTSADNDGTILVAADGMRWKRLFTGAVNVLWFGAVRTTPGNTPDNLVPVAAAQAFALLTENSCVFPAGEYFFSTGFRWDYATTMVAEGVVILSTDITTGNFIQLATTTNIAVNEMRTAIDGHFIIKNTLGASNSAVGLYFGMIPGTSVTMQAESISLLHLEVRGFGTGLTFGDNAYIINFYGVKVFECGYSGTVIARDGTTNTGEGLQFFACVFAGNYSCIFGSYLQGIEFFFFGGSVDYNGGVSLDANLLSCDAYLTRLFFSGVHFEWGTVPTLFSLTGTGRSNMLEFSNCTYTAHDTYTNPWCTLGVANSKIGRAHV